MKIKHILSQGAGWFLLAIAFLTFSCSNRTTGNVEISTSKNTTEPNDLQVIQQKELQSETKSTDQLGTLLFRIDFKLRANKEELEDFKDGIVPWISIDNSDKEIERLMDKDQIVLPYEKATLVLDYPLNNPTTAEIAVVGTGFSRKKLILEIARIYREIYAEEEKTATTKTIPREKRKGMINRNTTDGKYGIWGHDLTDLALSSVEVYRSSEGKILLDLDIES